MKKGSVLLWSVLAGLSFPAVARGGTDLLFIKLNAQSLKEMHAAVGSVEAAGVHVRHIIPPDVVIGTAFGVSASQIADNPAVQSVKTPTDVPSLAAKASENSPALQAYCHLIEPQEDVPLEPAPRFPEGGCIRIPPDAVKPGSADDKRANQSYIFNAEYMIGRVAVAVILMESTGHQEDWTSNQEATVVSELIQGADWLTDQAALHGANLSWVWEFHYGVPTTYEPINGQSVPYYSWVKSLLSWEFEWIDDALGQMNSGEEWGWRIRSRQPAARRLRDQLGV